MAELERIAPIVPVTDVEATVDFYKEYLGFGLRAHTAGIHAHVMRDQVGITLVKTADEQALKATRTNISAYIWVRDVAALWGEMAERLDRLPEGRVRAPFTQNYGMREFHVKDPDGFLIFFGEDADDTGES